MKQTTSLLFICFFSCHLFAQENKTNIFSQGLPDRPSAMLTSLHSKTSARQYYRSLSQSSVTSGAIFSTKNWSHVGPSSTNSMCGSGRVNTILQHPTNPNILWIGSASGGMWKSTNAGLNWQPKSDFFTLLGISKLLFDPNNPNKMYCATGDADGGDTKSFGILKSIDSGNTWDTTGLSFTLFDGEFVRDMLVQQDSSQNIVVLTNQHIYFSGDSSNTFSIKVNGDFYNLAVHPTNNQIIYATGYGGFFYRSINAGRNWVPLGGANLASIYKPRVSTTPAAPNNVYLSAVKNATDSMAIIVSNDMGLTWHQKPFHNIAQQSWFNMTFHVSNTDTNDIYFGAVWNWKSTDAGTTFTDITQWAPVHCDQHVLYSAPTGELFTGNDGGVWKTNDGGINWTNLNNNLGALQFYKMNICLSDTSAVGAGAQDNCFVFKTPGTGNNWKSDVGGDIMEVIFDPTDPLKVYAMGIGGSFVRSLDGGVTFIGVPNAGDPLPVWTGNWVTPLIINKQNTKTLYAGFSDVWKSCNGAANWFKISNGITGGFNIDQMAIAPSDSNTIYITVNDKFYATYNNGTTWVDLQSASPTFNFITGITVNPLNPLDVWISCEGFTSTNKVFRSIDGGYTWSNMKLNLPNIPITAIAHTGDGVNSVWLGTFNGMFYKNDTMSVWRKPGNTLPNAKVTDIEVLPSYKTVYISTYGRGMWKLDYSIPTNTTIATAYNLNEKYNKQDPLVFPTITNDELNVLNCDNQTYYEIHDSNGRKISNAMLSNRNISVASLAEGFYILRLENVNGFFNKKFIIKR